MGAYGGGGPAPLSSMSQGGVPGGGVVKLKKQIPSIECKFFDSPITCTTAPANFWQQVDSGAILSGIVQGTGPSQRIGRKIKVVGLIIRCAFDIAPTAWVLDVVRDKQCNGAQATAAQVYTLPFEFTSLPSPFEETRFQFIKRFQQQNFVNVAPGAATAQMVSKALKCNFTAEYNATTGAVTDLTSDNIQVYMNTLNTTAAAIANVRSVIRVLYTDA